MDIHFIPEILDFNLRNSESFSLNISPSAHFLLAVERFDATEGSSQNRMSFNLQNPRGQEIKLESVSHCKK